MPTPISSPIGVTIHGYVNGISELGRQLRWERAITLLGKLERRRFSTFSDYPPWKKQQKHTEN